MPREIVLGNEEMLVNLDSSFQIRDLYYPYVGWANYVGGHKCRIGVWLEDCGFCWVDETWERKVAYQNDTLVTDCRATHHGFGITLKMAHAVLHDRNVFAVRYRIENARDNAREVRLFLAQDLRVDESDIGDTVFYSPYAHALVHYKRDRYFLFGGHAGKTIPPPIDMSLREKIQNRPKKRLFSVHIDELLELLLEVGGRELTLAHRIAPIAHVYDKIIRLPYEQLTPLDIQQIIYSVFSEDDIISFEREGQLDVVYALQNRARFNIDVYRYDNAATATIRLISRHTQTAPTNAASLGPLQYACGEKGFRGAEGAWRDAEDGVLSMNAIAQGAVDSVAAYHVTVPAHGHETIRAWIVAGKTLDEVCADQDTLLADGFDSCLDKTALYWFSHTPRNLNSLPDAVAKLYTRSLLIIRTQCDKRGAILAANDTDIFETARAHYSYLWPRDGALVSLALDTADQPQISRAFFEFCARVLPKDRAALMHKYGPDGTIGALWHPWVVDGVAEVPFQEDGTALVVYALAKHVQSHKDDVFAARLWRQLARPCADFLAEYVHPQTRLPLPSWDLWEERRGCHVWTVASVIAALRGASSYALNQGDAKSSERFARVGEETLAAFQEHFWNNEEGRYARMVSVASDGSLVQDMTVDSSASALFLFGVLPADDNRLAATMESIGRALWVKAPVGGLARYEKDYYFRTTEDFALVPGNPWIICTLWLADWYCATAANRDDLRRALDMLEWAALNAMPTGVLAEQVHPFTGAPLSVAPLTWSHAQFVSSVSFYREKMKTLD